MLFFFRGHHGSAVRALVGAVLLAIGLVVHHGAMFAVLGTVLLVWGLVAMVSAQRNRRETLGAGRRVA
jgi:thiosulfate reductase cytochrome b subunit